MTKQHSTSRGPRRGLPIPWPILVLLVAAVAAVGYTLIAPPAGAAQHPEPRAGITAGKVQPPERYADDPRVAQVYEEVAQIAAVADGLYCYCHCERHSGHYSLLSCFESDHGAACDVCLNQAHLAYTMTQRGASLGDIRLAIDARYGDEGG